MLIPKTTENNLIHDLVSADKNSPSFVYLFTELTKCYVCLLFSVGPFQSDALLVPAGCIFDHVHESHVCKSFSEWNATAVQSCNLKNRVARSFAVLQPCEGLVSSFDGVEFVCCTDGTSYIIQTFTFTWGLLSLFISVRNYGRVQVFLF
jgi:Copper-binding of amyloid precursor, CuBD